MMAMIGVSACGRKPEVAVKSAPTPSPAEREYASPPLLLGAVRTRGGGALLSGQSAPEANIRLASPGGAAFTATADAHGRWVLTLPTLENATLFGLSAESAGRVVQAEGYIAIAPAPSAVAVLLRAGGGARVIGEHTDGVQITTVDMDSAGLAVISGIAPPSTNLTVNVDDKRLGELAAGPTGAYSFALSQALPGGRHRLTVRGLPGFAGIDYQAAEPRRPTSGPFQATRVETGWRYDWMTPGGGLQATLVLDPSTGSAP